MNSIIKLYHEKNYSQCLFQLKKIYQENPYQSFVYLFFFLVYQKLKKRKQALKWLKEGFYLLPGSIKIAELYAYYTVLYKKNPEEALIPIERLTSTHSSGAMIHHILSRFHYKKGDLERALFYSKAAFKENKSPFFKDWYVFLLFKYNFMHDLKKVKKNSLARRLTGRINLNEMKSLRHPYELRMALKERGVLLFNEKIIKKPSYQWEFYKKYGQAIPGSHPIVLCEILKEKNIDVLGDYEKKKGKKSSFFDENLIASIAWFLILFVIVLLIWRTFW